MRSGVLVIQRKSEHFGQAVFEADAQFAVDRDKRYFFDQILQDR